MRYILGIDVSKNKLNYALISDMGELIKESKVPNDLLGFGKLKTIIHANGSEIIFESTGVYSRRLQRFLNLNNLEYVLINPLKARKEMDTLRVSKNDSLDAKKLALLQLQRDYPSTLVEEAVYTELRMQHRFYQEISKEIVKAKNRVRRSLQDTFSEVEYLFSGDPLSFYKIVAFVPHADVIRNLSIDELVVFLTDNIDINMRGVRKRAETLKKLAERTATSVSIDSDLTNQVTYWAGEVIRLTRIKQKTIEKMVSTAKDIEEVDIISSIPGIGKASALGIVSEFGDIRRFSTPQKMNAFAGIDIRFNDSGQLKTSGFITKRGNSVLRKILYNAVTSMKAATVKNADSKNYVIDWYNRRSRNVKTGKKKIIVATMDRFIRMIHHLVLNNEYFELS